MHLAERQRSAENDPESMISGIRGLAEPTCGICGTLTVAKKGCCAGTNVEIAEGWIGGHTVSTYCHSIVLTDVQFSVLQRSQSLYSNPLESRQTVEKFLGLLVKTTVFLGKLVYVRNLCKAYGRPSKRSSV